MRQVIPENNTLQSSFAALAAASAFIIWGLAPLYFKQLSPVPATEILAHRALWSFVLLTVAVGVMGYFPVIVAIAANQKQRRTLLISTALIGVNWLTYIWAISNNRIVEASLGYYLTPIANILLAMVVLKEHLSRLQKLALILAAAGVGWQLLSLGKLPIVSLMLATTFSLYGLVRKQAALPAIPGLFIETLLMLPISLLWMGWLAVQGTSALNHFEPRQMVLLILAGVITSVPLLLFTGSAPKLRLTTLGFLQYIAPTLSLMLGVLVYHEPFGRNLQISFLFIWTGLIIFSLDAVLSHKTRHTRQ